MKTRAKKAEERQKFLQKLNRKSNRFKHVAGNNNEKSISVGNKSNLLKIKISREPMGSFAIQNISIDNELPALIKQEIIDEEYDSGQNAVVKDGCRHENVMKNSVSTQCHSSKNELWLYVGRNVHNTVDAQTQTSPLPDEYAYCRDHCQYLIYGHFCGPTCQFLHCDFGVT